MEAHRWDPLENSCRYQQQPQQRAAGLTWLCEVCMVAKFNTYEEASRHEIWCQKQKNKMQATSHSNDNSYCYNDREAIVEL